MTIDDDVRRLGLDLKHSPHATEIRLPSALGLVNGLGLGFFGLVALLFSTLMLLFGWRQRNGGADAVDGPRGLADASAAYAREFRAIEGLRDAYFRTHSIQPVEKKP